MELLERCVAIGVAVCGFRLGRMSLFEDGTAATFELTGAVSDEQFASLQRLLPGVQLERGAAGVSCSIPGVTQTAAQELVTRAHDEHRLVLTVQVRASAGALGVAEGLDAVRLRPDLFVKPVEARQVLMLAMRGAVVEVCARRATNIDVGFDGQVSISDDGARYGFERLEGSDDTSVEQRVERVTYQRTTRGRAHDEAAVVNGLSNHFSIEVAHGDEVLRQAWRLGRRVGAASSTLRRGRFDTTLCFEPDPLLFERPLSRDDVRDVVEHFARLLPRATFFFDGATFHVDTLEAAGRQVIGQTPLWSEPLFLFAIDEPGFTVRVALGLSDDARPPLQVLRNARVEDPFGLPARAVRRALAAAVKLAPRTEAPNRHLTGVIAFETVDEVKENDTLLSLIEQRFVEPWSVYLDGVPQARERLSALWSGQQRDAEYAGETRREE